MGHIIHFRIECIGLYIRNNSFLATLLDAAGGQGALALRLLGHLVAGLLVCCMSV